MQKPIAVIGTPGRIPGAFARGSAALFAETGANTGNLAFQHAVWTLVEEEKRAFPFFFDPAAIRESCRLVCIPAANFLYSGFDLGDLADRLAATGLPLMVLGLGMQASRDIAEVKLKPGTERLLRLFAERCATIAVRGRHTGAVLERHGVRNFEVLGCPSNFIDPDPRLGARILARWRAGGRDRFAYAPTLYPFNAGFERALYEAMGEERVVEIVAQDPLAPVALARGDDAPEHAAWLAGRSGFLAALPEAARGRAVGRLRAYFCAEAWLESYRRLDAVVGSRIHGVNLGWQAGRPALVVSHDLRTEELAETMGVPMVKADGLAADRLIETFDERVEACAAAYDERRRGLAARFAAALAAHGATPSAALRALGGDGAPAPAAAPAASAAPRVWGFLEQYNRKRVAGWVASTGPEPPRVVVRFDGKEIGRATPAAPRPDIDGHAWAFDLAVPPEALAREVMRVEAVIEATGAHLRNSPVVRSFAAEDDRKVLRGREGWLFLQNDSNGVLDQIQGRRPLSEAELTAWAAFLAAADGLGCPVFYLVAPNKECVAAEHLPEGVAVSPLRPVAQLAALVERMRLKTLRLVYPLEAMRRPGDAHPAYPKGDSHWSHWGAALALAELTAAAGGALGSAAPPPDAADYAVEYRDADLLQKLGGTCVEPQPVPRRHFAVAPVEDNGVLTTGRVRTWRSTAPGAAGRLLVVHDSFGEWLIPPLAERFAETTAVWGASVAPELVAAFRPTAVVFERAERFLVAPPAPIRRRAAA